MHQLYSHRQFLYLAAGAAAFAAVDRTVGRTLVANHDRD